MGRSSTSVHCKSNLQARRTLQAVHWCDYERLHRLKSTEIPEQISSLVYVHRCCFSTGTYYTAMNFLQGGRRTSLTEICNQSQTRLCLLALLLCPGSQAVSMKNWKLPYLGEKETAQEEAVFPHSLFLTQLLVLTALSFSSFALPLQTKERGVHSPVLRSLPDFFPG